MSINQLIMELKENEQDFEFYPTTKEMIETIYNYSDGGEWLDIGCGTCNFKKYFEEIAKERQAIYDKKMDIWQNSRNQFGQYTADYPSDNLKGKHIYQYYVIEKSKILIDKFDKDVIVLGTDFNNIILIDKPVRNVFCNPPYSEYDQWTEKIIYEANAEEIFMVIPQRWKDNENIQRALEQSNSSISVLGSFDFLHAERQARAKVDIVRISRREYRNYYEGEVSSVYNGKAFDKWFDETFKMRDKETKNEWTIKEEEKQEIKNKLVENGTSKAKILVDLYQDEMNTFYEHFKAITSLDVDVLETIGVHKSAIKEALMKKITGTKCKYWELVFDELEEITSRLTHGTRKKMLNKFIKLKYVDFTIENIYPLIVWVLKNASNYFEEQLIDFFKELSAPDNVKPYKSNQRVFERNKFRHNSFANKSKISHYTLDYRIIMSSPFRSNWYNGNLETYSGTEQTLNDIFVIAKNLGFEVGLCYKPSAFGEKCSCLYKDSDKVFMEYRAYKNGNMHVKFDIEFMKAMNVEVSRLLGWIKIKEDIKKEFPTEMAKGADKYFKINYNCIGSNMKLISNIYK